MERRSNGWIRLRLLPVSPIVPLAAKQATALLLSLARHLVLLLTGVAGLAVAGLVHPRVALPAAVPLGLLAGRTALVFLASLLVLAIQSALALRSSGIVLPLSVGIFGTFFGLFASGWRFGWLFPWTVPLRALHLELSRAGSALVVGSVGGLAVVALSLCDAVREEASAWCRKGTPPEPLGAEPAAQREWKRRSSTGTTVSL